MMQIFREGQFVLLSIRPEKEWEINLGVELEVVLTVTAQYLDFKLFQVI